MRDVFVPLHWYGLGVFALQCLERRKREGENERTNTPRRRGRHPSLALKMNGDWARDRLGTTFVPVVRTEPGRVRGSCLDKACVCLLF